MGALTLKSFPFELRGWDIEKFESIDPTDGFGSATRVYISKDKVVQIEPDYDIFTYNTWLTDKGRQFFDSMFGKWNNESNKVNLKKTEWSKILKVLVLKTYIFDHCNKTGINNNFFTVVFENLSFEILSLLNILSKNYSFIKIRRAENVKINNDLESNFQLNLASNKLKLNSSTLCMLISTNTRYEGYYLNLSLRQRSMKGNFKCLSVGSLVDLTFPVSFLGSNINVLKTIAEGNNLFCQEIKSAKNPTIILNTELFKRNDGNSLLEMIKVLNYSNIFTKSWYGLNVLNPSLYENGTQTLTNFKPLTCKDLNEYSSLYLLNVSTNNLNNFSKIVDSKLLNYSKNSNQLLSINKSIFDQNVKYNNNSSLLSSLKNVDKKVDNYYYLPNSMFYENSQTFVSTEGVLKKSVKLMFQKKTKSNWQILRRILKLLKEKNQFLDNKNNSIVSYNSNKLINFRNFINFQYYATHSLTNLNFYLVSRNKPFVLLPNNNSFKKKSLKLQTTKLKYWLDDFFNGGKDEYSHNSLTLANCSKILRTESTNFF